MNTQEYITRYGVAMVPALLGAGVPIYPSRKVWFVDSSSGNALDANDGEHGKQYDVPLATVFGDAGAVNVAGAGDTILVAPGHIETYADVTQDIPVTKTGISIVGFSDGAGKNRPKVVFNHANANIKVKASNVLIKNFNFEANVNTVTKAFNLDYSGEAGVTGNASGFTLEDCIFTEDALETDEFVNAIIMTSKITDVTIRRCSYWSQGAPQSFLLAGAVHTRITVEDCRIYGNFSNAILDLDAAATIDLLAITGNHLIGTAKAVAVNAGSTGYAAYNAMAGTTSIAATFATTTAMYCIENYVTGNVAASGIIYPAVDAD